MECRRHAPNNGRESPYPASGQYRARRATARFLPPRVCRVTPRPPLKSTFHLSYSFFSHLTSSPTCNHCPFTILRVAQSFLYLRVFFLGRVLHMSLLCSISGRSVSQRSCPPAPGCLHPPSRHSLPPGQAAPIFSARPSFPKPAHAIFCLAPCTPSRLTPDWLGLGTTNGALHSGAPCHKAVASLRSRGHHARLLCLRFRTTSRTRRSLSTHAIFRTDITQKCDGGGRGPRLTTMLAQAYPGIDARRRARHLQDVAGMRGLPQAVVSPAAQECLDGSHHGQCAAYDSCSVSAVPGSRHSRLAVESLRGCRITWLSELADSY